MHPLLSEVKYLHVPRVFSLYVLLRLLSLAPGKSWSN